ncbi:MAG: reverse transcriptase family protein [Sedimenticola sp.]
MLTGIYCTCFFIIMNFLSWNVRGVMSSAYVLSTMLDKYNIDIALLSEHKLLSHSEPFLDSINDKYTYFATIDNSLDSYSRVRCGKGGTAIMYKKSIGCMVTHIDNISSNRIVALEVKAQHDTNITIICVYMPSNNDRASYFDTLSDLQAVVTYCINKGPVVISGDFNAQISSQNCAGFKAKAIRSFVFNTNLNVINYLPSTIGPKYSFLPNQTMIDHLLVDNTTRVEKFTILDDSDMVLTSDHLPFIFTISGFDSIPNVVGDTSNRKCIAWNKMTLANLHAYQYHISAYLSNVKCRDLSVNELANIIGSAMTDAAKSTMPNSKFNKFAKPYWTSAVKEAHTRSRLLRKIWIDNGRPRGRQYESYSNYKDQKSVFRNLQRLESERYQQKVHSDLDEAADIDYKLFWRLLNEQKPKKRTACNEITVDGNRYYPAEKVADGFSKYFSKIFADQSDNPHPHSDNFRQLVNMGINDIKRAGSNPAIPALETDVTPDEIQNVIKNLKRRKAPGNDNIQNEHVINAGDAIIEALVILFNKIIATETVPDTWRTSIIIPLHKGNGKPKNEANSYRPISLLSCLCKIFERVILNRINEYITCNSIPFPCNEQQGFQKGTSCITASFNLQETIYYNLELGSNVLVAFLDIEKAFDSVWHNALFLKLHDLGITGKIWSVLSDSYTNLFCKIRVNGKTSEVFKIERGVRQGGVMSGFLYLVFIDELLAQLQQSGHGARICNIPAGNPTLADDISCIATSPASLQKLIDIIFQYTQKWRFNVNIRKSCILTYLTRGKTTYIKPDIRFGQSPLTHSESTLHLGIRQSANLKSNLRTNESCQKGKNSFYAMLTLGVRPLGLNPLTSASLYRKVIMPTVLYGSELWNHLTKSESDELNKLQHFIVKKIQGLGIRTRSDMCESMLGLYRITSEIDKRKLMLLHKILTMPNDALTQRIFIRRLTLFQQEPGIVRYGFVPDIYNILLKYDLLHVMKGFFDNPMNVPSKYAWKMTVRNSVNGKEADLWRARLESDNSFRRFKLLHREIKPAIVWSLPHNYQELRICDTVARLWTEIPNNSVLVCPKCELLVDDFVIHMMCECHVTSTLKNSFLSAINMCFGNELYDELSSSSSESFTDKVMGAELQTDMDINTSTQYLHAAFSYVSQCVRGCLPCS